jgi:hypothetical protein
MKKEGLLIAIGKMKPGKKFGEEKASKTAGLETAVGELIEALGIKDADETAVLESLKSFVEQCCSEFEKDEPEEEDSKEAEEE